MNTFKKSGYRYDALDLLVGIEPAEAQALQRFYCRGQLATVLQGASSQHVFQYDKQLLALQSRQGDAFSSDLLAIDQQRSVLQVAGPDGPARQAYAPYGPRRVDSGPGSLLGFTGEAVDPVTGHYLLGNGHRAFNPVLMRFNSPDNLSPFGRGGLNPYAYCLGDPVNFTDPTGQIGRLVTSLFSVVNARIVMSPAIPYKLGKDAVQWGAVGRLPFKPTLGAVGSTVAGITTMVSAVTAVGSAVAGITGDSEAAKTLGYIALGLAGLTVAARLGSGWAAKDSRTVPMLKDFVADKGRVPNKDILSAPPQTPDPFAGANAPPLTGGPADATRFHYPDRNRTINFLNEQIDRQARIVREGLFRRHSDATATANNIRRRPYA
ncbi:RHS repeat-associated core domain-containing protein [Pseudomonas fluorescens group sp. PF-1]